ncbi:hypothetical protein TNCV_510931 [Trichonephila clavipes]|nr:hypothetical protein TNCV_510931 [Trichonephila clavipes]
MECRSSNIKIYPSMGKNFKEDGNFDISNWQVWQKVQCVLCLMKFVRTEWNVVTGMPNRLIRTPTNGITHMISLVSQNPKDTYQYKDTKVPVSFRVLPIGG